MAGGSVAFRTPFAGLEGGLILDGVSHLRGPDRRRGFSFVVRERRSGFDRRTRYRAGARAAFEALLVRLRDDPASLVALLVLANMLSVLDLVLTLALLRLGVVEGNPLMRYLFEGDPLQAPFVKCGLILAISLAIWMLRRYRSALEAALFLAGFYAAIVLYEIAGLVWLT